MVLIDFSSIVHRMLHTAIANAKPSKSAGKFVTAEFTGLFKYYILQELFFIKQEFETNFGNLVICLDNATGGYWRRDIYPNYKSNRKTKRQESEIDYKKVFEEINVLIEQIRENLPIKVVSVPRAEADDIILVLSKEFSPKEKILIYSPDKDFIQSQRGTNNVFQYNPISKKFIGPEDKSEHIEEWIEYHCVLGDASDEIPKVVDHTEFSENFLKYLKDNNLEHIKTPQDFDNSNLSKEEKINILKNYNIYKTKRNGEITNEKDIYKKIRFGKAALKKKIKEYGSLDNWLDSNPLYRKNYERNYNLIMADGIPSKIWNEILIQFKKAKTEYNQKEFEKYLIENNLKMILLEMPNFLNSSKELSADDFGW